MSTATQPLAIPRVGIAGLAHEYSVLVKARVTTLIVMTAWCGAFFAAAKSGVPSLSWTVFNALLGIGLVSGGTAAINEVMERDLDARMRRTAIRPLVTGSLSVVHASIIAFGMTVGGIIYLWLTTNWQTALLTGLTSASYLLVYTPMKQVHPICTFLGAFPGAMPPLLGWVAIRGRIDPEAIVL
ncbi:MAG: protoheme IX farnesyltransferase, partial [Candidatus Korobacteraceae bacterium]